METAANPTESLGILLLFAVYLAPISIALTRRINARRTVLISFLVFIGPFLLGIPWVIALAYAFGPRAQPQHQIVERHIYHPYPDPHTENEQWQQTGTAATGRPGVH